MAQLAISNVINISVSAAGAGVGNYNTSNLGLFSDEQPDTGTFGTDGYKAYVDPTDVGVDFGTGSKTYQQALAVFSQQPNILAGDGQLIVILLGHATVDLALSGVAASGAFKITFGGNETGSIAWDDTAAEIQTALRLLPGLSEVLVTGSIASQTLHVQMAGVYGAAPALTVATNSLQTSAPAAITFTITIPTAGETLGTAITRTKTLVQYFGIIVTDTAAQLGQTDLLAAAAVIQALNKIGFFVSYTEADITTGGMIDMLRSGGYTQSRGLYYGISTPTATPGLNAMLMCAAYAGRALSTNFSGSNTTQTMNLKDLKTINPDTNMTQALYNKASDAGADIYASIQGVSKVVCFGANSFFDQVYNLQWFVGALQVAGFNFLATSSTKIPQTEAGMDGLKGAYRAVCEQAVSNQYSAPGSWTSATTFGNLKNFLDNIAQRGYYIYSSPIATQSVADRNDRIAPLIQIALKEAGAIQKSSVIVNVNA